jgi:hypothetical protein
MIKAGNLIPFAQIPMQIQLIDRTQVKLAFVCCLCAGSKQKKST